MRPFVTAVFVMSGWLAIDISAQEPHTYRLPPHIPPLLTGTYTLDSPTSSGAAELVVAVVEGDLQLRTGPRADDLIAERVTREEGSGTTDIYVFSVVNRPGVLIRFWLAGTEVTRISYAEDFSKPPIMTVGRRKPKLFDEFVKAIAAFPVNNIPFVDPDRDGLTGLRVGAEHEVMKRFGGPVEFAGTFRGISRDFDSVRARPTNRERIEMELAIPSVPGPATWTVLVYPKAPAIGAWKAVAPGTPVRFRAVVTGIALNRAFLPGVALRSYSILLEEAVLT